MEKTSRIGVFVCHCGFNIAETVDIEKVLEEIKKVEDVVYCIDNDYFCSDPGQKAIEEGVKEEGLTSVVVACCTPTMHETTFRDTVTRAGLNPYRCEIANIREQCSWVHSDKKKATEKAIRIIESIIEKVKLNESLTPIKTPVTRRCLVIGGGIAGIQASLDIADSGYEVILVEKEPSIGGHMIQLGKVFPTLDCAQCILTPKMVAVDKNPKIKLYTYSEIVDVSGYVGNFTIKIKKKPRYVDEDLCNLCDKCTEVCPVTVTSEFERGLNLRKAIYIPFSQAVPSTYTLDSEACLGLYPQRCDECLKVCEPNAIDIDMQPEVVEEEVGAVVVATGYDLYPKEKLAEYGYGENIDVVDALQFERMLFQMGSAAIPLRRPSDGKTPKDIVWVQCVGSRDPEMHLPYCSKICCMYTAKQAMLYKNIFPDANAYVFYIDIRAAGKDYEEFVQRAMEESDVLYLRGKVSKIFKDGDKTMVWGADTLTGKKIEVAADMVVLATGIVPSNDDKIVKMLKLPLGPNKFLKEAHPKLRPVETTIPGVYIAGMIQGPKDIPETVAQASGSASKAIGLVSSPELEHDPTVISIDEELCDGCGICIEQCPYDALKLTKRNIVEVNEVLCNGCGMCAVSCPTNALKIKNFTDKQMLKMIEGGLS